VNYLVDICFVKILLTTTEFYVESQSRLVTAIVATVLKFSVFTIFKVLEVFITTVPRLQLPLPSNWEEQNILHFLFWQLL